MSPRKTSRLLVANIGTCLTIGSPKGEGPLRAIRDAAVVVEEGCVRWVGPWKELGSAGRDAETVDAEGRLVTPGLVDCHTHLIFAGSRADEFFLRLGGVSYEAIAAAGGGIRRTVAATREATDEELLSLTRKRLDRSFRFGVTTVEIKSGYGLSLAQEIRLLRLIRRLRHPVDVVPTFLGAHVVPDEFRDARAEYVRLVCEGMLPQVVAEKLAGICDVFCDAAAFTPEETRTVLSAARALGLRVKLHAEQLSRTGAAELAAEFGALSADHLERVSRAGIRALAESGTVAVLLPGAAFSLGKRSYPPARKLLEAGVTVAVATDCNPGTSLTEHLPLMMSLAAAELRMTPEEIWPAVTVNAARALGLPDRGEIREGQRGDLVIWDAEDPREVICHMGASFPRKVVSA